MGFTRYRDIAIFPSEIQSRSSIYQNIDMSV